MMNANPIPYGTYVQMNSATWNFSSIMFARSWVESSSKSWMFSLICWRFNIFEKHFEYSLDFPASWMFSSISSIKGFAKIEVRKIMKKICLEWKLIDWLMFVYKHFHSNWYLLHHFINYFLPFNCLKLLRGEKINQIAIFCET